MKSKSLLDYEQFHLMGIKGVAMTGLAQCLIDAGKKVTGSDVAEDFVTAPLLKKLDLEIQTSFHDPLPKGTECVIYTSAHQSQDNPQVVLAKNSGLPTLTHAEALGELFNLQSGVAVCGVGGKSSTSGMLAWITEQLQPSSFAVGVGEIINLPTTAHFRKDSQWFIAEADEYVTDPSAPQKGEEITPRFSFLKPQIIVATNLKFDHPDVYRDLDHAKSTYIKFFQQLKPNGALVYNADDEQLSELSMKLKSQRNDVKLLSFGQDSSADYRLHTRKTQDKQQHISVLLPTQKNHTLTLKVPGHFNVQNALAALAATQAMNLDLAKVTDALASFSSTKRRFELIGEKAGVAYYDDYAHHPSEVAAAIAAIQEWCPEQRVVVVFQPHTFTRTKQLFTEFVAALKTAPELILFKIFASAREAFDPNVTVDQLATTIKNQQADFPVSTFHAMDKLADYLQSDLKPGDVCLTLGAGDIYHVHEMIK